MTIRVGLNPPVIDASNKVLHISDTPFMMFQYLKRVLRRLKPAWVIHTGDLVDDIKLEMRPKMLDLYKKKVAKLINLLSEGDSGVILVTGNHDHLPTLLEMTASSPIQVWSKPGLLYLGNFHFYIAHKYEEISPERSEYNLYGHNLERKSYIDESTNKFYLNGLEYMNLIDLESGDVESLHYPYGTDNARLGKKRVGI
jgi:predicted MPP superfamily phosphohydrolase